LVAGSNPARGARNSSHCYHNHFVRH
jgi:hypothetical protein